MNFDQGQFNFDATGPEEGYLKWREELDEKKRAFELRWGVILSRRVRVILRDYDKPLVGILEYVDKPRIKVDRQPLFRLKGMEFRLGDIESIVQDDED